MKWLDCPLSICSQCGVYLEPMCFNEFQGPEGLALRENCRNSAHHSWYLECPPLLDLSLSGFDIVAFILVWYVFVFLCLHSNAVCAMLLFSYSLWFLMFYCIGVNYIDSHVSICFKKVQSLLFIGVQLIPCSLSWLLKVYYICSYIYVRCSRCV